MHLILYLSYLTKKVLKFGGTSVGSINAPLHVNIVEFEAMKS